jgi:hypothetical protein
MSDQVSGTGDQQAGIGDQAELESAIKLSWTQRSSWAGVRSLFHRAGRLIHPGGELTLELNANAAVQAEFTRYLDAMTT